MNCHAGFSEEKMIRWPRGRKEGGVEAKRFSSQKPAKKKSQKNIDFEARFLLSFDIFNRKKKKRQERTQTRLKTPLFHNKKTEESTGKVGSALRVACLLVQLILLETFPHTYATSFSFVAFRGILREPGLLCDPWGAPGLLGSFLPRPLALRASLQPGSQW